MPEAGNGAARAGKELEAEREGKGLGRRMCSVWKTGRYGAELGSHRRKAGLCNGNRACGGARCDGQWSQV